MAYADEEILKARKARQIEEKDQREQIELDKEKAESIYDGMIHIYGRETAFSRRVIEELGLSLFMPDEFELLDEEIKKLVFPLSHPPKYVFASGDTQFQITLNPTENIVPEDGLPRFMEISKALLEKMGPHARILATATVKIKEKKIGIMEMVTQAVDMNVYNVMFYVSINKKLLIGSIVCPAKLHERMVPITKEILDSIEVFGEDKEHGNDNISEY